MNAIKNALVTTTLVAVGYGVYVILANPSPAPPNSVAQPSPAWGIVEGPVPANSAGPSRGNSWQEIQPPQLSVQMEPHNPMEPNSQVAVSSFAPLPAPTENSVPTRAPTLLSAAENPAKSMSNVPDPYLNAQQPAQQDSQVPAAQQLTPPDSQVSRDSQVSVSTPDSQVLTTLADNQGPLAGSNAKSLATPSAGLVDSSSAVSKDGANSLETGTLPPVGSLASGSPFTTAWETAERQFQKGKIAESLFTLSIWYQDPSFTEEQRSQCLKRMDELAAEVIYSRQHHLKPAYIVRSGETLETIANQFQVPSQFLARVNGIESPFQLVDGESIKVVVGPFRAEIDTRRREMTLFAGSYYAGRVPIEFGQDASIAAGSFEIVSTTIDPPYVHPVSREQIAGADPRNPYGRVWLGLGSESARADQKCGIHGSPDTASGEESRGSIRLSSRDVDNVQAILSLGSTVIIR